MKIYTRTGDGGDTSLFAGGRISKGHVRVHAYGTVDELNSLLGVVAAGDLNRAVAEQIQRVQAELFIVGGDLATPLDAEAKWIVRVTTDLVERLEAEIDQWDEGLTPLKNFILPGGCVAGALLHQARTVCRRAERWIVMLQESEEVNPEVLRYLNRLSDWLFVAARTVNQQAGKEETRWQSPARDKNS